MEKKKAVVLLHGFGEDHNVFKNQIEILTPVYEVFAPDLPGSGVLNESALVLEKPSIEGLADWVYTFLKESNIEKSVMLGHSMGGYITLAFAEKYPQKLEALGLLHSTANADSEEKKKTRLKAIEFIHEKGGFAFLKTAIPNLFGAMFKKESPEMIASLIEKARQFKEAWLEWYYKAMIHRPDRSHVLSQATVPVLIVAGDEDMAAPLADLTEQASLPAICHFYLLKETGHMGMLERKVAMNEILLNFMSSV